MINSEPNLILGLDLRIKDSECLYYNELYSVWWKYDAEIKQGDLHKQAT